MQRHLLFPREAGLGRVPEAERQRLRVPKGAPEGRGGQSWSLPGRLPVCLEASGGQEGGNFWG